MRVEVKTTHLEMTSPDRLRPTEDVVAGVRVERVGIPNPALNHFFFVDIGIPHRWYSRLRWSHEDWRRWVERDDVVTLLGALSGSPFGYAELMLHRGGADVEIVFFGILPSFLGRGLGGPFLADCVRAAWEMGPSRVWLHTCSEDHPHALSNHLDRGFEIFREETRVEEIPDRDDPAWLTPAYYDSLKPS